MLAGAQFACILLLSRGVAVQGADLCIGEDGFATVARLACPDNSTVYYEAGANLYNLLWAAWEPQQPPFTPHGGNLQTSLNAMRDFAAAGLKFFRVFASPWGADSITRTWLTNPALYWDTMDTIVNEATRLGLHMQPSILVVGPQWAMVAGDSLRDLILNKRSPSRKKAKAYVQELVRRYRDNPTVLMWGMGNGLEAIGEACEADKTPGMVVSYKDILEFSSDFVGWVKEIDTHKRPVNGDFGLPRSRAYNLQHTLGGGKNCVNEFNLEGDCDTNCTAIPRDTRDHFVDMVKLLNQPFDVISAHDYGCVAPHSHAFCRGSHSIDHLKAAKEAADEAVKPLIVGEFGSHACYDRNEARAAWDSPRCMEYPLKVLEFQAEAHIPITAVWTWCATGAPDGGVDHWCINSERYPATIPIVDAIREANTRLHVEDVQTNSILMITTLFHSSAALFIVFVALGFVYYLGKLLRRTQREGHLD